MRWRMADRIDAFEPWTRIRGCKAISLEEYSLLEPWGRPGVFPESLVLETCVHFVRWLAERSSYHARTVLLARAADFAFLAPAGMGDRLDVEIVIDGRRDDAITARCDVRSDGRAIASGLLTLELIPAGGIQDGEARAIVWKELHGPA